MLRLDVFDLEFNRIGIIEKYTLAKYEAIYNDIGSFQITCPIQGTNNIEILKEDRIIWFEGTKAGIIQYVSKSRSNTTEIIVKGSMINVFLDWRSIYPTRQFSGSPDVVMENIVTAGCLNRENPLFNFPDFEISYASLNLESITYQDTGDTVAQNLLKLSETHDIGYEVGYFPMEEKYIFSLINGDDRTINNTTGNDPVVFSHDLNNILSSDYILNLQNYRNYVVVFGEGEGTERRNTSFFRDGIEVSGYDLKELYIDARDLQSEVTDDEGNTTTIPDSEYLATLTQRGNEKLEEAKRIESYNAELRSDSLTLFNFGKEYDLGDTVTVIDKELDIYIDAVVTGVTVTETKEGYSVEPTFGFGQPTIFKALKRKGVI